ATQAGRSGHLQNSSLTFICHHVKVTPTAIYLDGPYAEQSNRVVRRYPGFESHFVRVSFKDEGGSWIRLGFGPNIHGSSKEWVNRILKTDGIKICDRQFKLLSYRSADLREHTCFFSSDFVFEGVSVTPESIRANIGDCSKVIHCPARYGSRLSQAFSSTDPSIVLSPGLLKHIPDITNADGGCFSDGCGIISRALAEKVWRGWLDRLPHTRRRQRHKNEPTPAVFQMRIGGSAGVVRIDPKLAGEQLCIRPSMTKLYTPNELSFEIVRTSERPSPCILNRFAKLSCLGLELNQPGVQDVGLRKLLDAGSYHLKLGLKLKARIQVLGSYTLVGKFDHRTGEIDIEYIEGWVLVSRSPNIHPGDCQRLYAIGKPPTDSPFAGEGNNIPNCIVFSSRGPRPVPNMLGGGDLGMFDLVAHDLFNIIRPPELMPSHEYTPAPYSAAVLTKTIPGESTIDDVADFMVDVNVLFLLRGITQFDLCSSVHV
ncbi:hypothetical protein FRC07_011353, partial [Ceratobasidium sp. 392]